MSIIPGSAAGSQTRLWRQPSFLPLWSAVGISQLGTQVSVVAVPLVAVLVLHAGTREMVLLALAVRGPLLLSLFAGVTVDRLRRRPIMMTADLSRAVLLGLVPLLFLLGQLRMEVLLLITLAVSILSIWFDVAYQSFLPVVIPRAQLVLANSRMEMTRSTSMVVGASFGGLLVQLVTAPVAVAVDALSYVLSALCLRRIPVVEEPRTVATSWRAMWPQLVEGMAFVARHPALRLTTVGAAIAVLALGAQAAVLVLYMSSGVHVAAAGIGLVLAAAGPGGIAGAVLASIVSLRLGLGWTLVGALALTGVSTLLVPAVTRPDPVGLGLLALSQLGIAVSYQLYLINAAAFLQMVVPDRLMGRVTGGVRFLVFGANPVGALLAGVLSVRLDPRGILLVAGLTASLTPLLMLAFRAHRLTRPDDTTVHR